MLTSTTTQAFCPSHGLVSPHLNANPNIVTVHCPQCFQLLGVTLRGKAPRTPRRAPVLTHARPS